MTQSNTSNSSPNTEDLETTRNLEIALASLFVAPSKPIVRKMLYDTETMLTTGYTDEDTNQPYIELTEEQYKAKVQVHTWKVVDGKLAPIVKAPKPMLRLVPGTTWYTEKGYMLIMGEDDGWDRAY